MQPGDKLLRELGDHGQPVPLTIDTAAILFFRASGDRQTETEDAVQKMEIAAIERPGERLLVRHGAAVMKEDGVEPGGLCLVLPAVSEAFAELHVVGAQKVAFGFRVVEDRKA